jgi:TDG/mug DNA glycosylase family protein
MRPFHGHEKKWATERPEVNISFEDMHAMNEPGGHKPSRSDLLAATGRTVPDVVAPGLQILFCGINPGLYSAFTGHHFARRGNRFWPALFASGFTERLLRPEEERELLRLGCGITNLVERASAAADELTREELAAGARTLEGKVRKHRPRIVAILGIGAYRQAFGRPAAILGPQPERMAGASVWVLPNPSGLNAHFTPKTIAGLFRKLRLQAERCPQAVPARVLKMLDPSAVNFKKGLASPPVDLTPFRRD